jgi:hypothetical protein
MTTTTKTRTQRGAHTLVPKRKSRIADATSAIRQIGDAWAHNWNAGDLEKVVAVYAPDAVYLPLTMKLCTIVTPFENTCGDRAATVCRAWCST